MLHKTDLHKYQLTSVEHIISHPFSALFLEMGLGKTVSTLTAINYLIYEDLEISTVLVVAPKRVAENVWSDEIEKWSHLQHLTVSKIIGTAKQRRAALTVKADIYTISRDNIAWLCGLFGGSMLPYDMLVLDELSSFKNPKAVRFKALRSVQPSFKRIVGLTGTPAPNGLIDLWAQIYLLDRGERLGKFITQYRREYFKPGQTNGHVVYNYKLLEDSERRIHEAIGDICISMKAEDYLELPERIVNVILIKPGQDIGQKYKDFERDKVLEIFQDTEDADEISAVNAAALSGKLLQFANGAVYDEDKNYHVVHDLKITETKNIIEEANGSPVLIAWTFRHDLYRLKKALAKYKPRELKTGRDIKDWNQGKIQVLLMHPASGGHGLNLQSGGHIIVWFGQTWSLEYEEQLNARLHRQGQKHPVTIHKLVLEGTIDIDVINAQGDKSARQNSLMRAVRARLKKYLPKSEK